MAADRAATIATRIQPTVVQVNLDAPLVILNLRAVLNTHTTALGILMTCATAWLQAHESGDAAEEDGRGDHRRR